MLRRRRSKVAYLLGSLLLLTASLHAPTAYSAPGDPPAGSPAGAVYQLPLEQGRADGAPKGSGGTSSGSGGSAAAGAGAAGSASGSTGAAGTSESGSLYRTENNFGSSSSVPGLAATGGGASGDGPGGGGAGAAAGGAASAGAGIAGGAVAGEVVDSGNTSVTAGIVLIGAIGLLAAAVGALSRRASRGRAGA